MQDESFEVRDLRNSDWYWIHRVVFEEYASKIGIVGLALYNAYASYARDKGYCYPNQKTIASKLGISIPTLIKYNKILEENGLIKIENRQKQNLSNVVYLLKLVKEDIKQFKEATKTDLDKRKEYKENLLKVSKPRRDLHIISLFVKEMGLKPENKEQFNHIIKRNLRAARNLIGYSDEQIKKTIQVCKNTDYLKKITLETICKYIDQVVAEEQKQGPKIIRFEEIKKPDGRIVVRPVYEE